MHWNITAEAISLVMLGIIWVYARKGSRLPTLKNRAFQGCLLVTIAAISSNILSTWMIYHHESVPMWLIWSVTMVYFVLTPMMGLAYYLYSAAVIYSGKKAPKKRMILSLLPGAIYVFLVLLNPFTGDIFWINMENGYTQGPWVAVTYYAFYFYCFTTVVIALANIRKIDSKVFKILTAFPVLAVIVIIVQQRYPNIILSGAAATSALLIIYLHLQNRQITMDYMTNLPNRQEFLDMLSLMLQKVIQQRFTIAVVSLQHFKQVNDVVGQQNGDAFLKQFARFLEKIGPKGMVYRFNGDEFALLFLEEDGQEIYESLKKIRERMNSPWKAGDYQQILSCVIGVVHHCEEKETLEMLIGAIEYAVAQAKTGKYGQVCYCDTEMRERLARKKAVIGVLKSQLTEPTFEMYYQPIYSVKSEKFMNAESLMRIPDSPIGPIYPSEFIPIAEETGVIVELTYLVLDKVCQFINNLMEKNIPIGTIHVNFSALQFSQPDLAERVLSIIEKHRIPADTIKIEFTESAVAENMQVVSAFTNTMLEHGIKMGLDDFGTGYSNVATVINIPFAIMKLDKSLIESSMKSTAAANVIRSLTAAFKQLGMKVIAEGVETEEEKAMVCEFGVDQIQGFYYARPMPEAEMEAFMSELTEE